MYRIYAWVVRAAERGRAPIYFLDKLPRRTFFRGGKRVREVRRVGVAALGGDLLDRAFAPPASKIRGRRVRATPGDGADCRGSSAWPPPRSGATWKPQARPARDARAAQPKSTAPARAGARAVRRHGRRAGVRQRPREKSVSFPLRNCPRPGAAAKTRSACRPSQSRSSPGATAWPPEFSPDAGAPPRAAARSDGIPHAALARVPALFPARIAGLYRKLPSKEGRLGQKNDRAHPQLFSRSEGTRAVSSRRPITAHRRPLRFCAASDRVSRIRPRRRGPLHLGGNVSCL